MGRPGAMANATAKTQIAGYVAGSWAIDPIHSDVSFTVRDMDVNPRGGRR
jgi:polyisoprenoid-binding protein YceI